MPKFLVSITMSVIAIAAVGQSFECSPNGPLPRDPALNCEGVACNGLGLAMAPIGVTGVESVGSCGFPTNGTKFLRIVANGPGTFTNYPTGGPFPRPCPATVTEVRIPIPAGAATVSFDWDFFSRECQGVPPANNYYDGMSIDVVSPAGATIQNLVYADTASPEGTCSLTTDFCNSTTTPSLMAEVLPNGPNTLSATLPALTGCEYISVAVWNGYDNSYASVCYLDNIQFTPSGPACPVPCFPPPAGPPTLSFSSPSGATCVLVQMSNLPPGGSYFMPVAFAAGNFPAGWFFGLDLPFVSLAQQYYGGFPFVGGVSASPCSAGTVTIGEVCGLPPTLSFWAVALGIPPGGSYPTAFTAPVAYTIP